MSRKTESRSNRAAFTLIELLVVIAIIATLAAVVAPSLFGNVGEARRSSAKSQIQILSLALDAYRVDNDEYPTTTQGLEALRSMPIGGSIPRNWKGPYLKQAIPLDPWRRAYVYVAPGIASPDGYDLASLGRDGAAGGAGEDTDVTSWGASVQP